MSWLILGLVAGVVLIGVTKGVFHFKLRNALLLGLVPVAVSLVVSSVSFIPANTVGVLYSPFSGVSQTTLSEGMRLKFPLDKVYKISTEVQTSRLENVTGQTQDAQYVTMNVDIKYEVDKSKAFEVFRQYRNLENINSSLVSPLVQRSIESVSTKYNIMEFLGEKRNTVYLEIENDLMSRFATQGITFRNITFTDTDAGEAIEQAIQAEAVAKKAVETAEQDRQKAEVEAQKRVVEAQANKDKAKIEAETKILQAEAEAKANELISKSITPEVLKKMEMEARIKHGWITVNGGSVITDTRNNEE